MIQQAAEAAKLWRLVFPRILEAAKAAAEGKMTAEQAASRFQRSPGPQEVKQWAADYRHLSPAGFQAKYGKRANQTAKSAPGEFDYDDVAVVLRRSIAGLEAQEREIEARLQAAQSKLEQIRKHLAFAEG